MAEQRPNGDSAKRKNNLFLHILLFGVLLVAALGTPFLPEKLKSYVFCNVFETRHWATVEPLVEGQKKHHGL